MREATCHPRPEEADPLVVDRVATAVPEQLSTRESAGQGDMDAANGLTNRAADAQQAEPQGIGFGAFEFGSLHGCTQLLHEHVGEGREHEAEGVGVEEAS